MPDPGYGPNGERLDPSGITAWEANAPPTPVTEGEEVWDISAVGLRTIPLIKQEDDDVWQDVYNGGA